MKNESPEAYDYFGGERLMYVIKTVSGYSIKLEIEL